MPLDALSWNVILAAALVAVLHTAIGPDHYVPFVMLARARRWSSRRALLVTGLCGLGHVGSSLALGLVGLAAGTAVGTVEQLESHRGSLAAWALVAFGLAYALWGLRRAVRRGKGLAIHAHAGHVHLHPGGGHAHLHGGAHEPAVSRDGTFWALFVVFVLGPCEPLIPLFLLPASEGRWQLAGWTALCFSAVTLATMLALVAAGLRGLRSLHLGALERWSHALAGGVLAASGLAVLLLPI